MAHIASVKGIRKRVIDDHPCEIIGIEYFPIVIYDAYASISFSDTYEYRVDLDWIFNNGSKYIGVGNDDSVIIIRGDDLAKLILKAKSYEVSGRPSVASTEPR